MPETQTPTFEIKKVKTFKGNDCPGYNLDLWMNGRKIAEVIDDGSGGMVQFDYVDLQVETPFLEYVKTLPPWDGLEMSEDLFVGRLYERHEAEKQLKRACAKHTVFKLPQDKKGEFRTMKTPFNEASKTLILKKHPNAVFINEVFPNGNWYEILERAPI
jgi:hypothetical protein